jgi:predicted ATP-dependent endonuclease of OLD family
MKLEKLILSNFRSYSEEIEIDLQDMNVFVGKNDIGKSTVLEALDIFFNEDKGIIKIEKDDINKKAVAAGNNETVIGAIFGDLPAKLTIDSTNPTTLEGEYLLTKDGKLEVRKKFQNAGKEKVFVTAFHPTRTECEGLLLKKQADLKKLLKDDMKCDDKSKNSEIRRAIWDHYSEDLRLAHIEIELAKLDARNSWELMKKHLPMFALFQSDRKNSDGDAEVQNPVKLAMQEILKDKNLAEKLEQIASKVDDKLKSVANRTSEKLKEMNLEIAESLVPIIPSPETLKWAEVFKAVSIADSNDIPISKRRSGVKRLILLNFFRAEAERRKNENGPTDIIYAIEEPETSQHPNHQRRLIEAFIALAASPNTQILMTTHSPSIVKLLDFKHLKLIKDDPVKAFVNVDKNDLPYPSLHEVNYIAFGEAVEEYHNELYGYIDGEDMLDEYKDGKDTRSYVRDLGGGRSRDEQKTLSEYIRHQIHHPENTLNAALTRGELQTSISMMRSFIQDKN